MNGGHDLGGMHGLGPINPEPEAAEPVFHAEWERRAFAVTLACGMLGEWNIDSARHARERQHPADYINNSYYQNWLAGLETLLLDAGLVSESELASGKAEGSSPKRAPSADEVAAIISDGDPARLNIDKQPGFSIGDQVRVSNNHPLTHTRAPRYVRGRIGIIDRLHGVHVFPDQNALGNRVGEPLYSVRFEAHELWGNAAVHRDATYIDLWEPYLEAV
ncbi:MAG: nitrile hydratase subunit beta [Rhizobiales bacterium]|nr:nitrile hydratase subunit beta [Hyphomicrobiales bacterium]